MPRTRSLRIGSRFGKLVITRECKRRGKNDQPLYECRCDCGNIKYLQSNALNEKSGTKSCGCGRHTGKHMRLAYGESAFRNLYAQYKSQKAKRRGHKFDIEIEKFREMTSSPCYYCGSPPSQVHFGSGSNRAYGEYIYNGLDRVDNSKGYIVDNVVPCCGKCNRAKGSMSKEEFYDLIVKIYFNIRAT